MIDKILTFEKESNNCWYIVLPEWTESHGSLMMVGGADTLLDFLSDGYCKVSLKVRDWFSGEDFIPVKYVGETKPVGEETYGGDYKVLGLNYNIWLCNVTKFVFGGYFPKKLYLQVCDRFGGYHSVVYPTKTYSTYNYKKSYEDDGFLPFPHTPVDTDTEDEVKTGKSQLIFPDGIPEDDRIEEIDWWRADSVGNTGKSFELDDDDKKFFGVTDEDLKDPYIARG